MGISGEGRVSSQQGYVPVVSGCPLQAGLRLARGPSLGPGLEEQRAWIEGDRGPQPPGVFRPGVWNVRRMKRTQAGHSLFPRDQ